ncbi:M56 family metallopeptidase [Lacibacter sediminis]|uniref:M48 family metalloprotease n=1 Tax=Lacibacter sediminis TaxID=2760713 RepID=A0A7G5XCT2_9BACT|nr:M56 family metallopeptidase [Lacibacter sediminis]QNA43285.1 M48 family metalloprotease [Lacibacter sediminis]
MPVLIEYLLKVSIALTVVYLFYQLVLRRLTFYNWNRWYLVGYSLLCFAIPFMNITDFLFRHELEEAQFIQLIPVYNLQLNSPGFEWNEWTVSIAVLVTGMLIMGIRILIQLFSLQRIKTNATLLNEGDVKLFDVNEQIVPFSFNNGIYINRQLHTEAELQEIIRHEFVHVKQKHSIDIMLAELLCMLLWFHPAAWLIRKAIRQNLEFIADEKVLQDGVDKKQYQYLLLKVVGNTNYSIAPNFNFSSLKNRIIMMNQIKSARVQIIRFLFVLPLVAVLLLAFREVKQKEKRNDVAQQNALLRDTVPANDIENINVNKNNDQKTITITLKNGTTETYNLNDEKEKAAFEKKYGKIDKLVPPPPAPPVVIKSNNVESVDVKKENGKNTIQIRLKDGSIEKYDLEIKEQREAVEKKYHVTTTIPGAPMTVVVAPAAPAHESVALNEKGYYVTIADNLGECVVIVKDKKKNIVEALKLTDWTKKEAEYEKKYGKIPPPPPPAPEVPTKVSVATTAGSPAAVSVPGKVSATSPVSPVKEVTVVGYGTKTAATVEGKPVTGSVNSTSPAASLKEVTVVGYATGSTNTTYKSNLGLGFKNGIKPELVLYILDGKEVNYDEVSKVEPDDIESVSVLKGESAEKAYGVKGKNGVIIIKTKNKTTTFNFFTTPWQKEREKC